MYRRFRPAESLLGKALLPFLPSQHQSRATCLTSRRERMPVVDAEPTLENPGPLTGWDSEVWSMGLSLLDGGDRVCCDLGLAGLESG